MHLEVGQVLSGTLRLKKRVAQGGMGTVWIAHHELLGTDVAVKVMSAPWSSVPSARTRFLREARMTATIDSPHVVRVLDCRFTEGDEPYLVLELLHGEDLEQWVRRRGVLPLAEVVEIIAQACEALAASHGAGFLHRDIKPENVFLVEGSRPLVKILDFGVAKPLDASQCLDVDKLACGTPRYMSPEQMFEPETTDERSDLFALACVAYFALTGHTPFEADSMETLYLRIDSGRFEPATKRRPELPSALDGWFATALANRPEDRFRDARAMCAGLYDALREARAEKLEAAQGQANAEIRSSWIPTQGEIVGIPRRRARRAPIAIAALAAAILVLVFGDALGVGSAVASPVEQNEAGFDDADLAP
jgi:serine/threonine-protein kinase